MSTAMQPGGILYPTVKAFMYFDIDDTGSGWNFALDAGGLNAFSVMVHSGYFNPSGCTATTCPQPVVALGY
jgi:hypothetical protein